MTAIGPDFRQPGPQESICCDQLRPLHRALQDTELVPEREVFQLQGGSRFEGRQRRGRDEMKQARQWGDLTKNVQTPCSHPVRNLR